MANRTGMMEVRLMDAAPFRFEDVTKSGFKTFCTAALAAGFTCPRPAGRIVFYPPHRIQDVVWNPSVGSDEEKVKADVDWRRINEHERGVKDGRIVALRAEVKRLATLVQEYRQPPAPPADIEQLRNRKDGVIERLLGSKAGLETEVVRLAAQVGRLQDLLIRKGVSIVEQRAACADPPPLVPCSCPAFSWGGTTSFLDRASSGPRDLCRCGHERYQHVGPCYGWEASDAH